MTSFGTVIKKKIKFLQESNTNQCRVSVTVALVSSWSKHITDVFFSDSSVVYMQQRSVMLKRMCLLFTGSPQSSPSLLPSGSSHSGVDGICSNSTVVVPVSGNLHIAIHAPFLTMTGKDHVSHLGQRAQDSGFVSITPL